MTQTDILSVREQIQEDLITLLDSQFGDFPEWYTPEYTDNVKDLACQIVIDNFTNLIK